MHAVDPKRLDLAREFKCAPIGPHSADLQKLLKIMRWDRPDKRWISVQTERGGAHYLAYSKGPRGHSLDVFLEQPFATFAEAQWAIFRKRWQQHTGNALNFDGEAPIADGRATPSADLVKYPLLGYSDTFSVTRGARIAFMISAETARYSAQVVRLRCGDFANVGLRVTPVAAAINGDHAGRVQQSYAGSYAEFADVQLDCRGGLTLEAWVWPTLPGDGEQAILADWDAQTQRGVAMFIDTDGALALRLGDGASVQVVSTATALLERHWYRVRVIIDVDNGQLSLAQSPLQPYARGDGTGETQARLEVRPAIGPGLRIAAWSATAAASTSRGTPAPAACFNGKIEAPRMWRSSAVAESAPADAHWDFAREMSSQCVVDISANAQHGALINVPTRAMKGYLWDGSAFNWSENPAHYGAIHFHDDDLHDCGWCSDFAWQVPDDLPSGLYCVHLSCDDAEDYIPFVVRPHTGSKQADLALLLPSAGYWAYANRHTIIDYEGREQVKGAFVSVDSTALYLHHHPELGLSTYDEHRDGSGVCYSSRLRPILSMRPNEALWQLPADTHIIDWLEQEQIAFDVITEDDLERDGYALLAPYRCVMTGTHPEYPSLAMLDAYQQFQANGGRFIYFGGNGFYWRVSYQANTPGLMEMRRGEDGIRAWLAEGGEYYHALTGELGGMWRRMGRAPQSVAGTGMTAQGFDRSTFYERTAASFDPRADFIFEGITANERIGDFGILGGGAAGWEIDRADVTLGTPPHALVVASASDFSANYHWMKEELTHTHAAITGETCPHVHCDMVFYETANGGAVFATSSIAWAAALAHNNYDNNVARLSRNVIERFLDPRPFDS